jgi:hypothetical protein
MIRLWIAAQCTLEFVAVCAVVMLLTAMVMK